jgi:hypothetical protein
VRAIFLLVPNESNTWTLQVVEDGEKPQTLWEFHGGTKTEQASRRLAAARIVTMVGNWVQNGKGPQAVLSTRQQPRWQDRDEPKQDRDEPKRELTYGTMGKFLGY